MIRKKINNSDYLIEYGFLGISDFSFSEGRYNNIENLRKASGIIGCEQINIVKQEHGNVSHNVEGKYNRMAGDALVTRQKNIPIAVYTADCVPVLLYDSQAAAVGIAHAGWRGAIGGIIQSVITMMKSKSSDVQNIKAVIGPCIRQESYEVDQSFYKNFVEENSKNKEFFINGNEGKYLFDLPGYCIQALKNSGLTEVEDTKINTYVDQNLWYSHRRSTHKNENRLGDNLSYIIIR